MQFHLIADLQGRLLESPVWDDRRGLLYLCDIETGMLHEVSLSQGALRQWHLGRPSIASLGLCESGRLVVALDRSVVLFDPDSGQQQPLWQGFDEGAGSRLNDGKTGPDGAFWVGSMDGRVAREDISMLYRITADGRAEVRARGFKASNGLAWSLDGRTMFHSDSMGPWIDVYDFDPATGQSAWRRRIRHLDQATGRPDGGACDIDGGYWSAGAFAAVLNRFDDEGELLSRAELPFVAPTMPCFCGPELRQMVVTSRSQPAADAPSIGAVWLAEAPVAGVAVARMRGC